MKDLSDQVQLMHRFFNTRKTYSVKYRIYFLKKLKRELLKRQSELVRALYKDFRKPYFETYTTEIYMTLQELDYAIKHLQKWTRPQTFLAPFPLLGGQIKVYAEPVGVVAVFAPYNYPIQLTFSPLIGAIAAGNCVVLKPSEFVPHTTQVIERIIKEVFPPHLVCLFKGNGLISERLLAQPLDYIFFTGSTKVGKKVMAKAAEQLIPVTLELGGKNPTIVDCTADLELAAKRIAWGKFINAGQTCVAPDYVLVHESVAEPFMKALALHTHHMFKDQHQTASLIHEEHYVKTLKCIDEDKVYYGGHFDTETLYVEPTLLYPAHLSDECMQEEVFGPVLPVIPFSKLSSVLDTVKRFPKPLACYVFSQDSKRIDYLLKHISFGGGCVNDTIMHLTDVRVPFGGTGYSGIGSYHGYHSFKTFSHFKTICKSSPLEIPLRYPPYEGKLELVKNYLRYKF